MSGEGYLTYLEEVVPELKVEGTIRVGETYRKGHYQQEEMDMKRINQLVWKIEQWGVCYGLDIRYPPKCVK